MRFLQLRLALGDGPHLVAALEAGVDQEEVQKEHPARVFQPAPLRAGQHAIDRLGPEETAEQVIRRHHDCAGDEDAPVAVEGQEGQRAKDVKVRLDAAAREVDEQRRGEHLRDGDGVAGERSPGPAEGQPHRQADDGAAQQHGRVEVRVRGAERSRPSPRRDDHGDEDTCQPFKDQQAGEHSVRAAEHVLVLLVEVRAGPGRHGAGACPEVWAPNCCARTPPSSQVTVAPGIRPAAYHEGVRTQASSTPVGFTQRTWIASVFSTLVAIRSSSCKLAAVQGQCG